MLTLLRPNSSLLKGAASLLGQPAICINAHGGLRPTVVVPPTPISSILPRYRPR